MIHKKNFCLEDYEKDNINNNILNIELKGFYKYIVIIKN